MIDRDCLDYTVNEIKRRKGNPYHMANEALADELYPYIKNIFPDMQMIKYGTSQWFIVSKRAKNSLKKQMEHKITEHKRALVDIQSVINRLN